MRLPDLRTSKIRGVQLAIVVDNKDGQGNPGYRVKLKFPWLNEQESTFWARIAVPMGGSDRGTYVLPEIDDQVLVVFEHGDINRPIVVGSLWSRKQEPVEINQSGKNNTKLIKSRSGHRIIFDDKEGAEKIIIVDKTKKNKIVLDSVNKCMKIESDGDIEVTAKINVIMHSNALKIGAKEGIIGRGQSLLAHAAKTFGVKATSGITIGGGNTTINVSSSPATRVSGSGAGELGAAGEEAPRDQVPDQTRGGGGGGGGGGRAGTAGRPVAGAASASSAPPAPDGPTSFVELAVVDQDDQPYSGLRYRITAADGTVHDGRLDDQGKARVEGIAPGTCQVTFPDLADDDWGPA
jgi:phage baseplate assembly protein gpV